MESVEGGVPDSSKLSSLHELETCLCFGVIGNYISDVLGGGKFYS